MRRAEISPSRIQNPWDGSTSSRPRRGVFQWGGEWIMGKRWTDVDWSGHVEDRALFDRSGNMLPAARSLEFKDEGGGAR